MHTLRLAYATQFLIAVIAIYVLWSQVGGQSHLDLMPWYVKLGLGAGAALAVVKATDAAVSAEHAWNGRTLKWFGILLVLLVGCGLASYYSHLYLEDDGDDQVGRQHGGGVGDAWRVTYGRGKRTIYTCPANSICDRSSSMNFEFAGAIRHRSLLRLAETLSRRRSIGERHP